ncbi:metallophosphoesterase [Staphylococcus cohnii]|uniref:metallophosphoesterase n=1 Tax=Staphylococcus cohnii TaxID=29382 RepID=UPI000D1C1634|nr:metallophosphoesterase [Staphylococcus cohnii]PTF19048.1 N-acetylmuramoyl-L-alanine amidase [Staphylococcus cohnii]PTF23351.1 N-acetylmuramoyl-L-alanine amidase [Staphylococcus cohnii]PTF25563.1 N-acetylmuramoyl-L-alanine amidase [Staphylococcus cohnii]PTF34622.1 N-acetylmuramoyl-L-alanine amidase [Staphylococcus cohnii]PTG42813.1 N-acetylmuramoyl-L-alanine amidase [Staphylococcus cohnii]
MKKSTSSIIFTMSAAGIFVGTQDASASELENQQKTTAATTNEMNQNDNKVAQTSDKVLETESSSNKVSNIEGNNQEDAANDTKVQSKANSNQNLTSSKNADEEVDQDTQITYKQQDESNKHIQPSDNQQQKELYTAAKEQPKLPNQSTSNQYNPGNNQHWENEAGKTDDATSEQQPKEEQLDKGTTEDNHKSNKSLPSDEAATIKNTNQQNHSPQQNNTERTIQESNNKKTTTKQTQSNDHRYAIMTIGKDNTEKNLTWYHESDEQGYVEIAEANEQGDFSNARRLEGETHKGSNTKRLLNKDIPKMNYTHATLPHLEENTTYMYRFFNGVNGEKSPIRRFDTNNNGETNFIAVADPQLGASGDLVADNAGWQNTVNQMAQLNKNPDFLMSLGDQVNLPWDEKAYSGFIEAKGMENFTVVPTLGNHDRANKAYSEHFNLPNLQNGGKNLASSDFYFTHNDTLFVSLNSESLDYKGHEETMKRAIADTKDQNPKWIVALTHRNPYSAGKHSDKLATKIRRDKFAPLMKKYNVDLVLGGHDHSYSRSHVMNGKDAQVKWDENGAAPQTYSNPNGTIYVTLNSASGSKFYELDGKKDYAVKSIQDNQPAYTKVNITKDYIEVLTYHVPQGNEKLGDPIDRVRINKDDN